MTRSTILVAALTVAPSLLVGQQWSQARSCLAHAPEGTVREVALLDPHAPCKDTYTLSLTDGTRLSACLSAYAAYNYSGPLTVDWPGHGVRRWEVVATLHRCCGLTSPPDTADIQAFEADLDGDGRAELVIAALEMVGNGLGIAYWNIAVISPDSGRAPQVIQAQDYDSRGSWVKLPGSRRCFFLASEWQVGSPTYFVGGLHPVVDAVVSDSVLPIGRARRRLYSFGTRPGAPPEPLGLLTDRRAHNVAASDTPALHQDW